MAPRQADDRAARVVLLLGIVLAAILAGLELADREPARPLASAGTIRLGGPQEVRVLLGRLGSGPWSLEIPAGFGGEHRATSGELSWDDAGPRFAGRLLDERIESRLGRIQIAGKAYRGRLLIEPGLRARRPILVLPLEDYLAQVLPGEMPMSYPRAALSAQVIAARSYVVWRMQSRRDRPFDVSDSESSQMFEPLGDAAERARGIVALSRGLVLSHDGEVLPAYYSANCGGHTRGNAEAFGEAALTPLAGVSCGHCDWSRHHSWTVALPAAEVAGWFDLDRLDEVRIERGEGSGYENLVRLRGGGDSRQIAARELRRRSRGRLGSSFLVGAELRQGRLLLSGHGFGHGVGLCQNGARGLALAGRETGDILSHYYPGAELRRLEYPEQP